MAGIPGANGGDGQDVSSAGSADDASVAGLDHDASAASVDYDFFVFDALTDSELQPADTVHTFVSGALFDASAVDEAQAAPDHLDDIDQVNVPYDHAYKIEIGANDNAKPDALIEADAVTVLLVAYFLL